MNNWALAAVVISCLPCLAVVIAPRRRLAFAIILSLLSPVMLYAGVIVWELLTRPPEPNALQLAFSGFVIVSAVLLLPWAVIALVSLGLGFLIRRIARGAADRVSAPRSQPDAALVAVPPLRAPSPATVAADEHHDDERNDSLAWRCVHLGFAHDHLMINGERVWDHKWVVADDAPPRLPHPNYPRQMFDYREFEIGGLAHAIHFAAAELAPGQWGFWVRTSDTARCTSSTTDGSLSFENRGDLAGGSGASASAALYEAGGGVVLADGAGWDSSRITSDAAGNLLLHLRRRDSDALLLVDPRANTVRDIGNFGADLPLSALGELVDRLRLEFDQLDRVPRFRDISPDGSIGVDRDTKEWSNSHWVNSPRVIETATGGVVLDLWETDWDADVSFPGERQVHFFLRRYHAGGSLAVDLDIARNSYQIMMEPGRKGPLPAAPLARIVNGLEASSRRSVEMAGQLRTIQTVRPHIAWRAFTLIICGALVALAAAYFWSVPYPSNPKQVLTPMPSPPRCNGCRPQAVPTDVRTAR